MANSIIATIRHRARQASLLMALAAGSAACGESTTPLLEFQTLSVAPFRVPCTGVFPTTCYLVRRLPDTREDYFYGGISGFVFEPGYRQLIRVRVFRIPDPPQDGSSRAYVLVRVLDRQQEAVVE